jgi:hypothetical protein
MMPPRAVWKIRPSGVVPYFLMWARSSLTSSGGMGMVRVSLAYGGTADVVAYARECGTPVRVIWPDGAQRG